MKPTFVIVAGLFTVYMGLGVLNPLLAPLVRELGLSETQGGLIITAAAMMFALGSPFWGGRSERWGRKPVLLIGLLGFSLGYGAFALAAQLGLREALAPTAAFVVLVLARALAGFLMGGVPVSALAFVADTTSGPERTAGIALLGAANGLGFIAGPALGAGLASFGLLAPLYAAAVLPLVAAALVALRLPHTPPRARDASLPRLRPTDPRIWPWLLVGYTIIVGLMGVQVTAGFLFQDRLGLTPQQTVQTLGVALVTTGVANLVAQLGIIRAFRVPPLTLLRVGLPLAVAGFAILIVATTLPLLILSFVVAGLGLGLALPGYTAAATLEVAGHEQGAVAGLTTSAQGFGAMTGPLLATSLYQLRPEYPYLLTCSLLALVAAAVWLSPRLR
ncbi:MAG TPA: MFS transporter, partial [Chloroflexaceae bacterium]|nr:MFS transporter [Chloroflexaceae bacterium]